MQPNAPTPAPQPTTLATQSPRQQWWGQAKRYGRGAFIAVVGISVGSSLYRQWKAWKEFITLPPAFYLELDLEQNVVVERASSSPLSLLRAATGSREVELHRLIKVLQSAKADERVRGMFAVLGDRGNFGGMAQLQELRNALLDFRFHVQGRAPVYAYSNSLCEGGSNGTGLYYLASAADRVYMPPTGMLALLGFSSSQVFVKELLDKVKVQPQVFRREEYKAALAPLTDTGYDPAHRQNLESLFGSLFDQVVAGIASARRLSPDAVQAAINASPLLPSQAMQAKLLDGLAYRDQVESYLLQQLPAEVQQAHQQPLTPPKGVPLAAAYRSKQLAGPRVSLQRYSLADEWAKSVQQFWTGGQQPTSGGSSSSSSSGSGKSLKQSRQQLSSPDAAAAGGTSSTAAATTAEGSSSSADPCPAALTGSAPPAAAAAGTSAPTTGVSATKRPPMPLLSQDRPIVAVVTAAGAIMQASSGPAGPDASQGVVESHKLVRVLRGYRDNPQVKAVVLRINSPGGSAVASDMIAREVQLLKEAGKPVVACMGDVAASGGYYIAAPCNKILAQPGTITGSIGVIFAKFNIKEALQEYGVTGDSITGFGDNAEWSSALHTLTPKQQQQIEGMIDATYDDFLSAVARGRGMSKAAVREVAKGRVWTGSQAMEVGLVDEVGGLSRATEVAKQLAGLPLEPEATITHDWPPSRVPPIVKAMQAAGGIDGAPVEASTSAGAPAAGALAGTAWHMLRSLPAVQHLLVRTAAAAELASLFVEHALKPSMAMMLPTTPSWQQHQQQHLAAAAALSQQFKQLQHPALAAAGGGGAGGAGGPVQQQLVSLLGYLAQQHNEPEMYCLDAELLSRSC